MLKHKIFIYLLIILFVIIAILTYEKLKLNITFTTNDPQLNELLNVNIKIKKFDKFKNADEVKIEIFNKYKKDESVSNVITPYSTGNYNFSYLPQYSGKYVINLTIKLQDNTYTKMKEVEI